jgi:hypothetical protein
MSAADCGDKTPGGITSMRISRFLLAAVVVVALPACSGISVDSVYDVQYDFTDLNSYTWEAKQPEQGPDLPYDLLDRWIKDSIDTTLAAKGYSKTTSQPSFKVIYYIGVDEITGINTTYYGGGWGGYWGYGWGPYYGGGTAVNTYRYDEATLTIDIIDPNPEVGLIWRGSAKGTVSSKRDSAKAQAGVDEAVQKMLMRFPPEAGQ